MFDFFLKTIVIGNSSVGKSTLLTSNSQQIEPTIGIDLVTENIVWNHKTIKMHVWDTSGNPNYLNLVKTYLSGCIGAFVVCNLNEQNSVYSIEGWIRLYLDYRKSYGSIIIVGNIYKNDYSVNYQKIDELCKKYNAYYIEIDAKKPGMITAMFKKMSEIILEDYKMNPNLFRNIDGFRDEQKIKNNGDYSIESGLIDSPRNNSNKKYCCSICSLM
jgi:small GTP-binding protein